MIEFESIEPPATELHVRSSRQTGEFEVVAWKRNTKMPKCSRFFDAQIAQIPRSRGMLYVERRKSNTLQTDVLPFRAQDLQISHVDRSKEGVAQ